MRQGRHTADKRRFIGCLPMLETAFAQDSTRGRIVVPYARLECVPPIVRKRMGNRISDGLRTQARSMHFKTGSKA